MIKNCFLLVFVFNIFEAVMFANVSPSYASEVVLSKKRDEFNTDLLFIHKTLFENHPGICNTLDPNFLEELENNFKTAGQKLLCAYSDEEKATILQELGRSFHDAHLWIHYEKTEASLAKNKVRSFSTKELKKGTCWITIPTFHPLKDQIKDLVQIIELLPQLRKQTIVFDLRKNGGGNSFWGEELLKALFGNDYVNQQLSESRRNVYAEWRISEGNLEHVKGLISIMNEQFEENHPAIQWVKNTYEGMQNAFSHGENYYAAPPNVDPFVISSNIASSFSGHVVAIIDKGCGSACLDFIDSLKAMHVDVTFIGETTGVDSVYMELRKVALPSGKGTLGFPIKVYRNRLRGHNIPHEPTIQYNGNLNDTLQLQDFVLNGFEAK